MQDRHPAKSRITKTIKTVNGRKVEEIVTETPKPIKRKTMQIVEHSHSPVTKHTQVVNTRAGHPITTKTNTEVVHSHNGKTFVY